MTKKTSHKQKKGAAQRQPEVPAEDIVFESEEEGIDPVKRLREKLKECVKEKQEYLDGWQRARADFQNQKKETAAEKERFMKFATEDLVQRLLPVLDSFNMAFNNTEAWEKVDKNWRVGVEYIYAQFKSVLEENGVEPIDPKGETFDPREHTSVEVIPTDKKEEDNIVTEVIQKGYRLRDRVIRTARVKVMQYSE